MTQERGSAPKSKKHLYGASVSMNTSRSSTKNSTLSTSAGSAAVTSASISDRPKRKSLCAGLVIRMENPLRVRTCGGSGRGALEERLVGGAGVVLLPETHVGVAEIQVGALVVRGAAEVRGERLGRLLVEMQPGARHPEVEQRGGAQVRSGLHARGRDSGRRFGHCGGSAGAGQALEQVGRLGEKGP